MFSYLQNLIFFIRFPTSKPDKGKIETRQNRYSYSSHRVISYIRKIKYTQISSIPYKPGH
ncbi:hypothetical protein DWW17_12430 [Bacteroides sp. AF14-46]|nr:hypothetical protein DWW17_12430 [Bacteroides sp. AF14-46]